MKPSGFDRFSKEKQGLIIKSVIDPLGKAFLARPYSHTVYFIIWRSERVRVSRALNEMKGSLRKFILSMQLKESQREYLRPIS